MLRVYILEVHSISESVGLGLTLLTVQPATIGMMAGTTETDYKKLLTHIIYTVGQAYR